MNVLLLGGHGYLGPHVVEALEDRHELRITDIKPIDSPHQTMQVDISDLDQVRRAAVGMDAIVNCSVLRQDRRLAFDVNTLGTYNAIRAAVENGMERFINTGPHFTLVGSPYTDFDFGHDESVPPQPGTSLYAFSKACGQEICRVFAEQHPIHVMCLLFMRFAPPQASDQERGRGIQNFAVTFADAARAIGRTLEVDLETLPSRNELFFIVADLPHGAFSNTKARRLLGWQPQDSLEGYWRPSARA